jgi:hypothetical protein
LIRCREVDWRSKWYLGLQLLSAPDVDGHQRGGASTQDAARGSVDPEGREAERWLRTLRVSAREEDVSDFRSFEADWPANP